MTDDSSQDDSSSNPNGKRNHVSYRRARASRACEVCHSRKVRCDVTNRMPCTNCVAFGCECKCAETKDHEREQTDHLTSRASSATPQSVGTSKGKTHRDTPESYQHESGDDGDDEEDDSEYYAKAEDEGRSWKKRDVGDHKSIGTASAAASTISDPAEAWVHMLSHTAGGDSHVQRSGRVAYLGSSSNLSLLVQSKTGDTEGCHYPLPDEIRVGSARVNELDPEEIEILNRRGAFLLPPRDICDELVEGYFAKIHPIVPMINRTQFMKRYNDPKNPPSLLLLQSILLAGTRVSRNPALLDQSGSSDLASLTLYKRAKALYDANYEDDRIAIVQSLVLLGWWWEGPEDVTKNVFYWTRVALCVAQGFGLHRSVEKSQLDPIDKKIWKRLWWVLFSRDRHVAIALGRPVLVNTDDTDVPMLTEEDFIEEDGPVLTYPPNRLHVQHFIQSLKLSEIMGLVLRQQFSVASETSRVANRSPDITHSDMALGAWINQLPKDLQYNVNDRSKHDFFIALLHLQYYTVLCLLHRTNMSQAKPAAGVTNSYLTSYPSRSIAFQSAHMIAKIIENMSLAHELRFVPAFTVYTLFSAMIMFVYQTKSNSLQVVESAQRALKVCMDALEEVGRSWMVGKMILRLFQKINENKQMKDRIFRAVNPRRAGSHRPAASSKLQYALETPMPVVAGEVVYSPIVPNVSYERTSSRPATPSALSPVPTLHQPQPTRHNMAAPPRPESSSGSYFPPPRLTAPSTPSFQASASIPGTPPDFYFVTHSPPISQTFFENFQPSQLFPDGEAAVFQQSSVSQEYSQDWDGKQLGSQPKQSVMEPEADQDTPEGSNGSSAGSVDVTGGVMVDGQGTTAFSGAPSSLNIGDWYNYLITNNAAEGFEDDLAELAQSSGLSIHY